MGMNPETNKFESLGVDPRNEMLANFEKSVSDQAKTLAQLSLQRMDLLRPDGTPVPKHWTVFSLSELVNIKGYTFRVAHIGESHILFEPVGPMDIAIGPLDGDCASE